MRLLKSIHTFDKIVATSHSTYSIKSKQTRYVTGFVKTVPIGTTIEIHFMA